LRCGANTINAKFAAALAVLFRSRQREWNIRAVVEQRVEVSPTRFRVPDVTVLHRSRPIEQNS
jgi:hypothetical protein